MRRFSLLLFAPLLFSCSTDDARSEPALAIDSTVELPRPDGAAMIDAPPSLSAEAPHIRTGESLPLPNPSGERQVGIRLAEYEIQISRDTVPAGAVEFHVVNGGRAVHIFVVRGGDVYSLTPHLSPADSTVLTVDLPPGEYQYICGVRDDYDHFSQGMRGTLVVR